MVWAIYIRNYSNYITRNIFQQILKPDFLFFMESTWLNHVKYPKLFNQWHNEFNIISEMCSFKVDSQKSVILSKDCLYLTELFCTIKRLYTARQLK